MCLFSLIFQLGRTHGLNLRFFFFFCALGFKEAKLEDRQYGLVDNEAAVALANGASNLYAFRLHHGHNHHHHLPNLHLGDGFGAHELRLP
jgi:hypothetical protein